MSNISVGRKMAFIKRSFILGGEADAEGFRC